MNTLGWTSSHSELHRIRFLDWLHENTRDGTLPRVGHYSGSNRCRGGIEAEMLEAIAKGCEMDGLIEIMAGMGRVSDSSARLLPAGTREVHQRRERRAERGLQALACRDALVSWLHDLNLNGQGQPGISLFNTNVRGNFEGEAFDQTVINQAAKYLRDKGLIAGSISSAGYPPRPQLTDMGIDCAEQHDSSVQDYLRAQRSAGDHFTTHFHGEISGQVGVGGHVQQTQHQGLDVETLSRLLLDVRQAASAPEVDDVDAAYLLTYADTIQAEVSAESPNPAVLHGSGERLKQIAAKAGDAGLVASVAALVNFFVPSPRRRLTGCPVPVTGGATAPRTWSRRVG